MNIKDYIIKNLKDCSIMDVKETVIASVNSNDEVVLPGLGVLFEMVWNNSDNNFQNEMVEIIYEHTKKA
ncbi:MAG: small acid-soluble spore protein SspI [Bacilli bacterium]|nr:small acid-soluble spore protein SspI [Bacilli bacterium]